MRARHVLLSILAGAALATLAGCSGLSVSASAPAFVKDVDTLRADHDGALATLRQDHDGAIAQVRSDLGASIEQVRADVLAARTAGERAFADALAAGRSMGEATAERVKAETAAAIQAATDAMAKSKTDTENALKKSRSETDLAVAEAAAKADKAKRESEGAPGWMTLVIALLGTTGVGGVIAKLLLSNYDKKPFVGSDGTTMAEGPLVDALARALGTSKPVANPPA